MPKKRILQVLIFSLSLSILLGNLLGEIDYTPEQKYLFDIFKKRRSVRKFKSTPVPDEHILKILDMARCAPTSGNQQPWKFFVIKDRKKLDQLKNECVQQRLQIVKMRGVSDPQKLAEIEKRAAEYYTAFLSAPVYVAVLVDQNSRYPSYNIYDGSLAAGYLMIAARALGYGTVFATDSISFDLIKKVFDIPDHFERICFTPIGVPETWPEPPAKKPLKEFVVFEKFIKGVNYTLPIQRKAVKLDPKILQEYVGKYELSPGFVLTVTGENEQLYAQATGQPRFEIFPESQNEFFLKVVDAQITFIKDEEGKVTRLILHQGGKEMPAQKIE